MCASIKARWARSKELGKNFTVWAKTVDIKNRAKRHGKSQKRYATRDPQQRDVT